MLRYFTIPPTIILSVVLICFHSYWLISECNCNPLKWVKKQRSNYNEIMTVCMFNCIVADRTQTTWSNAMTWLVEVSCSTRSRHCSRRHVYAMLTCLLTSTLCVLCYVTNVNYINVNVCILINGNVIRELTNHTRNNIQHGHKVTGSKS